MMPSVVIKSKKIYRSFWHEHTEAIKRKKIDLEEETKQTRQNEGKEKNLLLNADSEQSSNEVNLRE